MSDPGTGEGFQSQETIQTKPLELPDELRDLKGWDGKVMLARLAQKLGDSFGEAVDVRKAGFFRGDADSDKNILSHLSSEGGDNAARNLPAVLNAIHISRDRAVDNLAKEKYLDLSPNQIREKIQAGEIPDPYSMKEVEVALSASNLPPEPSITSFEQLVFKEKPAWWDEFSPAFRDKLGAYMKIPQ